MSSKRLIWFRLPQTLIRFLACQDLSSLDLLQVPFQEKYAPTSSVTKSASMSLVRQIKEVLFPDSNLWVFDAKTTGELLNEYDEVIIDSNLIFNMDLHSYIRGFRGNLSAIDYASGSFSPIWSDFSLANPGVALSALARSARLKKRLSIKNFYDWTGAVTSLDSEYIPWFWKSIPLDFNLFKQRCFALLPHLSGLDVDLKTFQDSECKVLFLPGNEVIQDNFLTFVINSIEAARRSGQLDIKSLSNVFVKPHRSIDSSQIPKKTLRSPEIEVIFLNSPLTKILPSEILIHGTNLDKLFSILGSSVFGVPEQKLIKLPSPNSNIESRSYAIAVSRSRKHFSKTDRMFPW